MKKTTLRSAPHSVLPGAQVFELFYEGEFIGQVVGNDGAGIRLITKFPIQLAEKQPIDVNGLNCVSVKIYPHEITVHYMNQGTTACNFSTAVPKFWPEGHKWSSDWDQVNCTDCLKGRDPIQTYEIAPDGKSIKCLRCKIISNNPNDVEMHFCPNCKDHDSIFPHARYWWVTHPDPQTPEGFDERRV